LSASKKSEFSLSIILVIALLVAVSGIYLFVLAMAEDGFGKNMERVKQQGDSTLAARIKPVESLDEILGATPAVKVEPVAQKKSGEDLYNAVCAACHSTGAAGAPKLGDAATWSPRAEQGVDGLLASAKAGKGAMPPKGGSSYSDDEMKSVIEFMLDKAGLMGASTTAAAVEAEAPAPQAAPAQPVDDEMQNQASVMEIAATSGAPAHDLVAGEAIYKKVCFACHDFAVAGAPKLGDKAGWEARIATGFDALLNTALHGKGAMPAKGGNPTLSDDEIKNTVAFMMDKVQ
jgi:cytochrome c5